MSIAAKCTCGASINGLCSWNEKCAQLVSNTQLPDEVIKEIKAKAKEYTTIEVKGMVDGSDINPGHIKYAYEAGATEYATKLQVAQQEIESLTNQLKTQKEEHEWDSQLSYKKIVEARYKLNDACSLLETVLAFIPGTETIHDKIQTFLDGK